MARELVERRCLESPRSLVVDTVAPLVRAGWGWVVSASQLTLRGEGPTGGQCSWRTRGVLLGALLGVAMPVMGAGIASATSTPGAPAPGNGTAGSGAPGGGAPGTGGQAPGQRPGHGGGGHTTPAPPPRPGLPKRLVYRMEVRVSAQYVFTRTIDDPFAAGAFNLFYGNIIKSTEDFTKFSEWSATSSHAFVMTRRRRHVYFSASLAGELARLSYHGSIDDTQRDDAHPGSPITDCVNQHQSLSSPLELIAAVQQFTSGGADVLQYYITTGNGLGNFVGASMTCNGYSKPLDRCGQDCTLLAVDGGDGRGETLWSPDRLIRRLAFKLPALGDFGNSFSITRTINGATNMSGTGLPNPPQQYAQITVTQRSHLTYTFKFIPCPRHGRDFQHC